ncbi:LPXTG cell wall anchor domain-containing protein, partial [Vagococcus sp.]
TQPEIKVVKPIKETLGKTEEAKKEITLEKTPRIDQTTKESLVVINSEELDIPNNSEILPTTTQRTLPKTSSKNNWLIVTLGTMMTLFSGIIIITRLKKI